MRNTDHTSSQDETKAEAEAEEAEEEEEEVKADIKSNNPHLTGGEKHPPTHGLKRLSWAWVLYRFKEKRSIIDCHLRRGDTGEKI